MTRAWCHCRALDWTFPICMPEKIATKMTKSGQCAHAAKRIVRHELTIVASVRLCLLMSLSQCIKLTKFKHFVSGKRCIRRMDHHCKFRQNEVELLNFVLEVFSVLFPQVHGLTIAWVNGIRSTFYSFLFTLAFCRFIP